MNHFDSIDEMALMCLFTHLRWAYSSTLHLVKEYTMNKTSNLKHITVSANLTYHPHGKRTTPLNVNIICEVGKRHIWKNAQLKEVTPNNFFIDKIGTGHAVVNEKGNRGMSLSRFITEETGHKPIDGNPLNTTIANWSKK
jgi:hypothetical protein